MTDDAQAGHTHERRAAVFRIIDPPAKSAVCAPRQQVPDLAGERALQLLTEEIIDHFHETFAEFERDVAGKAVAHDHVGGA